MFAGFRPDGYPLPHGGGTPASTTGTSDTGTFTLTGKAARLLYNRLVKAAVGTFTLTGKAARLLYNRLVRAVTGVFVLTGKAARLLWARRFLVSTGAFIVTGYDAMLRFVRLSPRNVRVLADVRAMSVVADPAELIAAESRALSIAEEPRIERVESEAD